MNIDNINRVIDAIRNEPQHFAMVEWITANMGAEYATNVRLTLCRGNPCNTAGCLGGWMDSLALADIADGKMTAPKPRDGHLMVYPTEMAAAFIGVEAHSQELHALFHMEFKFGMPRFDRLPDAKRAEAGARALEIFRDNGGKSDWRKALEETGLLSYMRGELIIIDGITYY